MPEHLQCMQLSTDKTNAADLSSGVFTILFSFTWTIKIQNPLLFHKFHPKVANSDVTKEALNCTASIAADSIVDAIRFIRSIVL